jgi:phospholipid/cholesterol/gamma-HCH transport system permease protein
MAPEIELTFLEPIGRRAILMVRETGLLILQLWATIWQLPRVLPMVGGRRRWQQAVQQMFAIGVSALPMVGMMSFCLGFVLTLEGAADLRRFGILKFVIALVAASFTRELGALVTGIAVSSRSASAIAAEIGTMRVTGQWDALLAKGINPIDFVLAPKFAGALITIPCLAILSTVCGLFAGYLFLSFTVGINARIYSGAVFDTILLRDVWIMLIKSVVFATIIVQVSYFEGVRASGGPEAIGKAATFAALKSTFLVIVADLGAAFCFYLMGWNSAG